MTSKTLYHTIACRGQVHKLHMLKARTISTDMHAESLQQRDAKKDV